MRARRQRPREVTRTRARKSVVMAVKGVPGAATVMLGVRVDVAGWTIGREAGRAEALSQPGATTAVSHATRPLAHWKNLPPVAATLPSPWLPSPAVAPRHTGTAGAVGTIEDHDLTRPSTSTGLCLPRQCSARISVAQMQLHPA